MSLLSCAKKVESSIHQQRVDQRKKGYADADAKLAAGVIDKAQWKALRSEIATQVGKDEQESLATFKSLLMDLGDVAAQKSLDSNDAKAIDAVRTLIQDIFIERDDIATQVESEGGRMPAAPFMLADIADLTKVLRKEEAAPEAEAQGIPTDLTPEQEYNAARERANKASGTFRAVAENYLAKKIGDAEFLAAKKIHDKANADFDAAEAKYLSATKQDEPDTPAPIIGYGGHPADITAHEADIGGRVVYSHNGIGLVEGFSVLSGKPVYVGAKGTSRTRADIGSYTGKMFSPEELADLKAAKEAHLASQAALHSRAPDGPFAGGHQVANSAGVPASLANVAEGWLSLLGLKARVFLTTKADMLNVQSADKYSLYGPFAAIRYAGLTLEADGGMRRLSNGDYYITLPESKRLSATLETLGHEIGHILEKEEWENASDHTRNAVLDDYNAWLKKAGETRADEWVKQLRAHTTGRLAVVTTDKMASDLMPYWRSFSEYFADQTAKWATSAERPVGVVAQFFHRIATALRNLYSKVAGQPYLPSASMRAYLDSRGPASVLAVEPEVAPHAQEVAHPKTMQEFQAALEAGQKAHYDYAGVDGTTVWLEDLGEGKGWVVNSKDDGSTVSFAKGGNPAQGGFAKYQALARAMEGAQFRFEQWKPLVAPTEQAGKPDQAAYGSTNTLVTKSRAEELRAKLKAKLGQLNAGIDPEMLAIGAELAAYHIEAGARSFGQFVRTMASDLGASFATLRPYLRGWYNGARDMIEDAGLNVEGMDSPEVVRAELAKMDENGLENSEEIANTESQEAGNGPAQSPNEPTGNGEVHPLGEAGSKETGGQRGDLQHPATPPDSQGVGTVSPGNAGATEQGGNSGATGEHPASSDVRDVSDIPESGDAVHGRPGTSGTGVVDAGTGGTRDNGTGSGSGTRLGEPDPVVQPGLGNYHITDPAALFGGGPKRRFGKNRDAIQAFRAVTEEGRDPTPAERDAMAAYTGWGSFGQELFKGNWNRPAPAKGWENEDQWLREHLGRGEWESAQASILNAHYTDPPTVQAMWGMLQQMGFAGGRILEPSIGIGNFFGLMPREVMERSQLSGIELDQLTGGMAKLLYPDANVQIKGYQESKTADNFYDLIIGNWPFAAETSFTDRRYRKLSPTLHDYFFLKAIDQVRPGGLVVGITSNGTMDKMGISSRLEMAKKADLIAAFRLPTGAFQEYAGTKVVTDILILRKRDSENLNASTEPWIESRDQMTPAGEPIRVNAYWAEHPGNVLGDMTWGHGTTSGRPGMIVERRADFPQALAALPSKLADDVYFPSPRGKEIHYITNNTKDRQQSVTVGEGNKLMVVQGEYLAPLHEISEYRLKDAKKTADREAQVHALIGIRKAYGQLMDAERAGDANTESLRKALNKGYKAFVKAHGQINDSAGLKILDKVKDPFYPSLAALEVKRGDAMAPSRILTEPTLRAKVRMSNPSIRDAFVMARNDSINLDTTSIAEISGKPEAEVIKELSGAGMIFRTPAGNYEVADQYLSGNVRRKLHEAEEANAAGQDMAQNIAALQKAIPKTVPYYKIEAKLGAPWVPPGRYEEYFHSLLNLVSPKEKESVKISFHLGHWKVEVGDRTILQKPEANMVNGSLWMNFDKIFQGAMNNIALVVWGKDDKGNSVVDHAASEEVNQKAAALRENFSGWIWANHERRLGAERDYNEVMNAIADAKFDGSFLTMEGMALQRGDSPFNMRQHQLDATWRGLVNRMGIYAHEVGTGKTMVMGALAVESRRYGISKKPLIFAHNANSSSVAREIQEMYPAAKILYVDNLAPERISVVMRQIANDDWDAVVVPHSLIDRMALSEETLLELSKEDIAQLEEAALEAAQADNVALSVADMNDEEAMKKVRSSTAKELVKARNQILKKISDAAVRASREGAIPFEELGVDMIIVDEAHVFKKPPLSTRMKMKGLNKGTSDQSISLRFLTDYVKRLNAGTGVHLFTGTPITNTLTEIYNLQRYVAEAQMSRDGIKDWDSWFNTFADSLTDVELTPTGEFEPVTRLASFVNTADLRRMIGGYTDIVFADDMPEFKPRETKSGKTLADKALTEQERAQLLAGRSKDPIGRPYKQIINDVGQMSQEQQAMLEMLASRAEEFKSASGKDRYNMIKGGHWSSPVIVETDAAKAGLDPRLVNKNIPDSPQLKINRATRNILHHYNEHHLSTQVVFVEKGFNSTAEHSKRNSGGFVIRGADGKGLKERVETFNLVETLVNQLVDAGIPREQIAVVSGSTSKEKRKEIADKMNLSKIRVVIGSTATLGTGVNMQSEMRAMHHLDAPWMPGELEQRNGRGWRQGNHWNTVLEYRYITDRIDGRRWQVLAVKDRFIKEFLKADENTRIIEGDAASMESDEGADILASLSEAAGDPRLLLRQKLRMDVERLEKRMRMHDFSKDDAIHRADSVLKSIEYNKGRHASILSDANHATEEAGKPFTVTFLDKTYTDRKAFNDALADWVKTLVPGSVYAKLGEIHGFKILGRWPHIQAALDLKLVRGDNEYAASPTTQSMEATLRNLKDKAGKFQEQIQSLERSIPSLKEAAEAPFPRLADLQKKRLLRAQLESDLAANPTAPPAWLRQGAPVQTKVYVDETAYVVEGHQYGKDGYFVILDTPDGVRRLPYDQARDDNGMALYEAHPFATPPDLSGKITIGSTVETASGDRYEILRSPVTRDGGIRTAMAKNLHEGYGGVHELNLETVKLIPPPAPQPIPLFGFKDKAAASNLFQSVKDMGESWPQSPREVQAFAELTGALPGEATDLTRATLRASALDTGALPSEADSLNSTTRSRAPGLSLTGLRQELAQSSLARLVPALEDKGLLKLHETLSTVPGGNGLNSRTVGRFTGGVMHLIAGNIKPGNAYPVLMHEGFHKFLHALKFSDAPAYKQLMTRLSLIDKSARSGDLGKWFQEAARSIPLDDRKHTAMRLNELAAYAIQAYENAPRSVPQQVVKWVQDFIAAVRNFIMAKTGWIPQNLTAADLSAMARNYLDELASGKVEGSIGDAESLSAVAWHGTQHVWAPEPGFPHGRPRLDKIGTGEGAQAYGFGWYSAEARDVGAGYQKTLAFRAFDIAQEAEKRGLPINAGARGEIVRQAATDRTPQEAAKYVQYANSAARSIPVNDLARFIADYREASRGSLYQLDIPDATLPFLLDWDKPLSEQTKEVRDALGVDSATSAISAVARAATEHIDVGLDVIGMTEKTVSADRTGTIVGTHGVTPNSDVELGADPVASGAALPSIISQQEISESANGADLYRLISRKLGGDKSASRYLSSIKVVGNRYLDGQSRNRPLKDIKREFLEELPEDADFAEVSDLIGTGRFSPKNDALLSALRGDDWLGFDYPAQAISAALSKDLSGYDASPELLRAVESAKEGGTYNFVIWDQGTLDKIALLERNGEKLDAIRASDEAIGAAESLSSIAPLPPTLTTAENPSILLSRRAGESRPQGGMTREAVEKVIQPVASAWKYGEARVVQHMDDLPDDARPLKSVAMPDTIDVAGVQRPTMNSNGKPIHPTEEGVRNFWRWACDDAVTDDDGMPQVFFNYGSKELSEINAGGRFGGLFVIPHQEAKGYGPVETQLYLKGPVADSPDLKQFLNEQDDDGLSALRSVIGVEFGEDALDEARAAVAKEEFDDRSDLAQEIGAVDIADMTREMQKARGRLAKIAGFGSVRIEDEFNGDSVLIVDGQYAKSVTGNNGDFSRTNPSILMSMALDSGSLPSAFRNAGMIEGAYMGDGVLYLVADAFSSPVRVLKVLTHESVGHMAMEELVDPEDYQRALRNVQRLEKLNTAWRNLGRQVDRSQPGLDAETRAKEILALATESGEYKRIPALKRFVDAVVAAVKKALRAMGLGGKWADSMSEGEIFRLLRIGEERLTSGPARDQLDRTGASAGSDVAYASQGKTLLSRADPSARYSRVGQTASAVLDDMKAILGNSTNGFNFLHKSISTQMHKATVVPEYRPIYEQGISYENDIARFSYRPANLAPDLLPQFSDVRNALKKILTGNKDQKYMKAVGDALFAGTLDGGGDPAQGKVWSDADLKNRFKLDAGQIKIYRQARAAIDASLLESAASVAFAQVKKYAPELREDVRTSPETAADQIDYALREMETQLRKDAALQRLAADVYPKMKAKAEATLTKAQSIAEARNNAHKVFARADELASAGYAPLMRFGRFAVDVTRTGADGTVERLLFSKFETETEAKLAEMRAKKKFPGATVTRSTMSEEVYKLFAGIDPETVMLFADHMEGMKDEVMQEWYRKAVADRSSFKRMIHREGVPGFENDIERVTASFITSNARLAARQFNMGEMKAIIQDMQDRRVAGDVVDEAMKLQAYLENPQEPFQGLKGIMFAWYLGGSVASAAVNATQPIMMTLPYLSQFGNPVKFLTGAVREAMAGKVADPELANALLQASEDGKVDAQEIHNLYSQGMKSVLSRLPMGNDLKARAQGITTLWGMMFGAVENFNRRLTFISAYRMAKAKGLGNAYDFATKAVDETQGVYSKANRTDWARGTGSFGVVGVAAFTFKQFSISYVELLIRMLKSGPNGRRGAAIMLGTLLLASGLQGAPGADNLEDLIDTLMQAFGYTGNSKLAFRRMLVESAGKGVADMVMYGALTNTPIDVQGRLGLGNLIPATGILKPSEKNKGQQIAEIFGPPASMAKMAGDFVSGVEAGQSSTEIIKAFAPLAIRNFMQGLDMLDTGVYKDAGGKKVASVSEGDAFGKMMGFQPTSVASETRPQRIVQQTIDRVRQVTSDITQMMALAVSNGEPELREKANARLKQWNEDNPDARIRINPGAIMQRVKEMKLTRDQRMIKAATPALRSAAMQDLQ